MSVSDLLELLKTLNVVFGRLATSTGARCRNSVGSLHQHSENRVRLNVSMVSLNGVDDGGLFAITAGKISTDHSVGTLDIMIDCLAKVVQKACALGGIRVNAKLGRHD